MRRLTATFRKPNRASPPAFELSLRYNRREHLHLEGTYVRPKTLACHFAFLLP